MNNDIYDLYLYDITCQGRICTGHTQEHYKRHSHHRGCTSEDELSCAGLRTTQCLNSTGSACPVALGHRGCIRAGDAQSTSLGSPGQVLPLSTPCQGTLLAFENLLQFVTQMRYLVKGEGVGFSFHKLLNHLCNQISLLMVLCYF